MLQGGIDPGYALDRMEYYEMRAIAAHLYMRGKEDWERTRFLGYIVAQMLSKNKLKPEDLIKFAWEKDTEEKPEGQRETSETTKADIERMQSKARFLIENNLLEE